MEYIFCSSNKINMDKRDRKTLNILERRRKGEWRQLTCLVNLKAAPSSGHLLHHAHQISLLCSFMFLTGICHGIDKSYYNNNKSQLNESQSSTIQRPYSATIHLINVLLMESWIVLVKPEPEQFKMMLYLPGWFSWLCCWVQWAIN